MWSSIMSISAFEGEFAAYSNPSVLHARPTGNLAASMMGVVAILILGLTSALVKPKDADEMGAGALPRGAAPAAALSATTISPRAALAGNGAGAAAFDLTSSEFAKENKEFSTVRLDQGGRGDILTIGEFSGDGAFLRLSVQQAEGEKLGNSDFYLDMSRQAQLAGLAAARVEPPSALRTRFGDFEAANIRLTQIQPDALSAAAQETANGRPCVAARMLDSKLSMEIVGMACGASGKPIDQRALGCIIDRLALTAGSDNEALAQFFAHAEPRHAQGCPAAGPAQKTPKASSPKARSNSATLRRSTSKR
jgi:hypothetical protein